MTSKFRGGLYDVLPLVAMSAFLLAVDGDSLAALCGGRIAAAVTVEAVE